MGKGLNKNRKISNDRVKKPRSTKNKILIAVEGNNKTEKNYFNNFERIENTYNISYARGNNTDPLKLVQMLIKEIREQELDLEHNDKAFCVFDTDLDPNKNKIINNALRLAKENNIRIITSTPSIELWFLLHYEYTTASMSNEVVIDRLKKYYSKYEKNVNIFPAINDNVEIAIKNAKKLERYQIDNNRVIGTVEANPSTEMYKIVEELR